MDADDLPHLPPFLTLSRSASESGYAASGVPKQGKEGKKPEGRKGLHHCTRKKGACGRVEGKKRGQGSVAASTGTFFRKQTATDGLRYTTHVGRKATRTKINTPAMATI
jgi:hypothetical protein